jgi:hypothetical protein
VVFLFIIVFIIISVWQRYVKRHKKALGKARNQRSLAEGKSKSGAEGESLKLLKESGAFVWGQHHVSSVFAFSVKA